MDHLIAYTKNYVKEHGLLNSFFVFWALAIITAATIKLLGFKGIMLITGLVLLSTLLIYVEDKK
jgi:hypothetical protein